MPTNHAIGRSPSKLAWIVAYVLSPALPFICLRYARAIGTLECVLGVLVTMSVHIGLVTILGETNGDPLQIFIVLLLGLSLFVIVLWQFLAGQRVGLWSDGAQRRWKFAGRFFGGLLAVATVCAIVMFHLQRHFDSERRLIEKSARRQFSSSNTLLRSVLADGERVRPSKGPLKMVRGSKRDRPPLRTRAVPSGAAFMIAAAASLSPNPPSD